MLIIKKLIFTTLLTLNWFKNRFFNLKDFFTDFNQNRFWIHRYQFSIDFDMWGFYLRHRHCVPPLLRVTDSRRPMKPVWIDQIKWGDPEWTCSCVVTVCHVEDPWMKIESKRLQMFCKRLVLVLIVCEMIFSRTQSSLTSPNSKKWVIEINLTVWICYRPSLVNIFFDAFQSKSFLDPQRSIFNRFWYTRILSPS